MSSRRGGLRPGTTGSRLQAERERQKGGRDIHPSVHGYPSAMSPLMKVPSTVRPSVNVRAYTDGARPPRSVTISVKSTGAPLSSPVPTIVSVSLVTSSEKVDAATDVDWKLLP